MISICRTLSANVERRRDGQRALRWCAARVVEAASSSAGSTGICTRDPLRDTRETPTETVSAARNDETVNVA